MIERKAGWYWVEYGRWQCAHWDGQGWHLLGISEPLHTARVTRVGHRIPAPDEPWMCVPKEPTEAMLIAEPKRCHVAYQEHMEDIYSAMLSAAPSPSGTPSHAAETTDNQESAK